MFSEETREKILAQARVEAEDIRRQASVEGVQAGHEKGMARAREELAPVFEELKNSIKNVMDYRGEVLRLAEQEIFELTILISKKVISSELQMRPEIVLEVVRNALDRAVGWGKATIQVNPEDYAFLEEHRLLLNEEGEEVSLARFDANPSITRGGCVLESNFGEIDARLEKQIEAVDNALRETLADRAVQQSDEANDEAGEPGAALEVSSEPPPEEMSDPEENEPPVEPYQPKDMDVPPEEPQGQ
jgi:flagellar assembly protein FliH